MEVHQTCIISGYQYFVGHQGMTMTSDVFLKVEKHENLVVPMTDQNHQLQVIVDLGCMRHVFQVVYLFVMQKN